MKAKSAKPEVPPKKWEEGFQAGRGIAEFAERYGLRFSHVFELVTGIRMVCQQAGWTVFEGDLLVQILLTLPEVGEQLEQGIRDIQIKLRLSVGGLKWSASTRKCLGNMNSGVHELVQTPERELLRFKGLTRKQIREIKGVLQKLLGLSKRANPLGLKPDPSIQGRSFEATLFALAKTIAALQKPA